jgi:SAM-dependent methyltransferase
MSSVPYEMWVGYTRLLFAQHGAEPDTLLDVCCGTGTAADMFDEAGYEVAGFDLSEPMIGEARRKAKKTKRQIDYTVADAAELDLGRQFDAAYSFFDSLNYITDPKRLEMAIRQIGKHIKPDGLFVFDINTAYAFEQDMFTQEDLRQASKIRYKWVSEYDPETKIIRVQMKFWKGREVLEEVHVQRAHTVEEISTMLALAGFPEIHLYDSYTLDPPNRRSDRIHFAARKSQS